MERLAEHQCLEPPTSDRAIIRLEIAQGGIHQALERVDDQVGQKDRRRKSPGRPPCVPRRKHDGSIRHDCMCQGMADVGPFAKVWILWVIGRRQDEIDQQVSRSK